ncbi:MAG: hypothetical protein ACR2PS_02285 [Pseudomonadales bacterium]
MSDPTDTAREAEFNDWYDKIHLPEMLALDGIQSAQRFRRERVLGDRNSYGYLTLYDIETDDIDAVINNLTETAARRELTMSDAIDTAGTYAVAYEELGPPHAEQGLSK